METIPMAGSDTGTGYTSSSAIQVQSVIGSVPDRPGTVLPLFLLLLPASQIIIVTIPDTGAASTATALVIFRPDRFFKQFFHGDYRNNRL